jgi:transcriptional regulator with XRE-family HTH domain
MKPTSSGPAARTLAASLREEREARKVGLRALADKLGILPQTLSLWEKGQRLPSVEDVSAILGLLQVTGERRDRIRALARHAREPNWLAATGTDGLLGLTTLLASEADVSRITTWSPLLIPGLLQTPDYIRSIMDNAPVTIDDADSRLRIRLQRQHILSRGSSVRLDALIGERALQENFGSAEIMSDQFDHLLEMSLRDNISIRIVRAGIGYHQGLTGPFDIYDFDDAIPIAIIEQVQSCAFFSESAQTLSYRQIAKLIRELALSEAASRELLQEVAH